MTNVSSVNFNKKHKQQPMSNPISVGLEIESWPDVDQLLETTANCGFQFGSTQVIIQSSHLLLKDPPHALTSNTLMIMDSPAVGGSLIGSMAPWVELDSSDMHIRRRSETLVKQQVNWACHIGLTQVMFTAPSAGPIANFSRVVNSSLDMMHYTQAIVRVSVDEDGWNTWNKIRMTSKHNPRLGVAIDVSFTLPETDEVNRWNAEPVKLVILSTKIFLKNSSGFPVLSKRHQQFVKLLMQVAIDLL